MNENITRIAVSTAVLTLPEKNYPNFFILSSKIAKTQIFSDKNSNGPLLTCSQCKR